jgi:two-component system sensor histidine kinase KdpD
MENRPNPEKLLRRAQSEEKNTRGKLKIYFGASPGVGKTYRMLEDALVQKQNGLEVVIGLLESHGRAEIEKLAQPFEVLPRKTVIYKDHVLEEFDLDLALKRNPALLLVDELAHTNPENMRHKKRWQDIKELLDSGISIYTTLNVQHIESVNDIITKITGIKVRETVPDSVLKLADTIELIDLSADELIKRLREGKVYVPERIDVALTHFFKKENLVALRELALRITADYVETQVLLFREGTGIEQISLGKPKALVCIGSSVESTKVIRIASRIAERVKCEWIAVHVETPSSLSSESMHQNTIDNLRLAEQLGAETKILTGTKVADEIINFANQENVNLLVVGQRQRSPIRNWFIPSLADTLSTRKSNLDIYIVNIYTQRSRFKVPTLFTPKKFLWRTYFFATLTVAAITVINYLIYPYVNNDNFIPFYLLGVICIALTGQVGPSIFASILSIFAYDYFFIPPYYSFSATDAQYIITLLVMIGITSIVCHLTLLLRHQTETYHLNERRTSALLKLSRQLAKTRGVYNLLAISVHYLSEIFDSDIVALLPEENDFLIPIASTQINPHVNNKDQAIAQWTYELGQIAGLGTDTLHLSESLFIPLVSSKRTVGVLKVNPQKVDYFFTPEQIHLLEACANQIGLAIEIERLHEQETNLEIEKKEEHVRNTLLQSISLSLKSPLVSMQDLITTLNKSKNLDPNSKVICANLDIQSIELNRLTHNLLQITYLDKESLTLDKKHHSIEEIITSCLEKMNLKLGKRVVTVNIAGTLPKVLIDRALIEEVLINILDNAVKFTPASTPIDIFVAKKDHEILTSIRDHGEGIASGDYEILFNAFYHGKSTTTAGLGLGLAICRRIITAHEGKIWADNSAECGAIFCFTLPVESFEQ